MDCITNAVIRNMSDAAVVALTKFVNDHWFKGTVPEQWKHANVIIIPKPGKKLAIENLRPISLTSCLGKIFERVVNVRLQQYLEESGQVPDTMYGFRAKLSTQDILLQLKEEVLTNIPNAGEHVILAIDIKGAFDNVSHQGILEGLANTNCGERTYNYVRSFLSQRTAELKLGEIETATFHPPNKGTPQGAVISPTLFNIAMIGLARKLQDIQGIRHAFYADDITIWTTKGSLVVHYNRAICPPKRTPVLTRQIRNHKNMERERKPSGTHGPKPTHRSQNRWRQHTRENDCTDSRDVAPIQSQMSTFLRPPQYNGPTNRPNDSASHNQKKGHEGGRHTPPSKQPSSQQSNIQSALLQPN